VEHFPPKLWGGFDHPDLMHSVCWGDNSDWGSIVKSLRRPNFEKPIVMSLPVETDIKQFAARLMASAHRTFIEGARRGDVDLLEVAVTRMESAWPLWYWSNITEEKSRIIHPASYRRPTKPVVLSDWSMRERFARLLASRRKRAPCTTTRTANPIVVINQREWSASERPKAVLGRGDGSLRLFGSRRW
jgi:hypothetical protein